MSAARPAPVFLDPALALAEAWQRDFPLCREPFAAIGARHGLTAREALSFLADLLDDGRLARIGATVAPNTLGASTLAALAAPDGELERIAAIVSAAPEVNHNYEREHRLNLWFVVVADDREGVAACLRRIEHATGARVLDLPLERAHHIDLGFRLGGPRQRTAECRAPTAPHVVDARDRALIAALAHGLMLVERPFVPLAGRAGCDEDEAIGRLARLVAAGTISRLGCILRHRPIGLRANAMAVWDVPDEAADALGERLAAVDAITLCYRRRRALPDWRYNLFAMIHGRERSAVEQAVAAAAEAAGLSDLPGAVLFSRRCFKQDAARYGRAQEKAA